MSRENHIGCGRRITSAIAALTIFLSLSISVVLAAKPNNQACVGYDVSTYAQEGSGFGEFVSTEAIEMQGLGEDIQAHQAGLIPDEAIPNTCND